MKVTPTIEQKYFSINSLAMSYGMYRDSFARLLDALLVERKDIRPIRIGRKVLYIKKEIDSLMMVTGNV